MNKPILTPFITTNNTDFDVPIMAFFISKYSEYPSYYTFRDYYETKKVQDLIIEKYNLVPATIKGSRAKDSSGNLLFEDAIFELKDGLVMRFYNSTGVIKRPSPRSFFESDDEMDLEENCHSLFFEFTHFSTQELLDEILDLEKDLEQFKRTPKKKGQINIVTNSPDEGLQLKEFKTKQVPLEIPINYGESFEKVHDVIFQKLNSKDETKGLVLLYGDPGTGKTSYIRHLINTINDKKIIYLTPDLAGMISDPSFVTFLLDHPNSILVIEDGENILRSRKSGANQSVANLLNLADGLLSDALNMQLICTFNCDIGDIDSALLRKGRLIAKHKFELLSIEDSQKLSDSLGFTTKIEKPTSLADIYNQNEKTFEAKDSKGKIGFGK